MRNIIYYVATSLDGFIAGLNEEIDLFVGEGSGVQQYLSDLQDFDTVIMGRKTYEFGYQYGLQPGQPAYPHMDHYIFSESLQLEDPHEKVKVVPRDPDIVKSLKAGEGKDIYLCGGGIFAGWLLQNEMIDYLKIKLNPIILGQGIPLFKNVAKGFITQLTDSKLHDGGLYITTYKINY